jgi:WhiB family redox-sensing transcriptional regulator
MSTPSRDLHSALGADYVTAPQGQDLDWQEQGACSGMESWVFFPEERGNATQVQWAKRICRNCPVLETCRNWALSHGEKFGVWGGLSERERREILKEAQGLTNNH